MREAIRTPVLEHIATSTSAFTWICTDQQSSSPQGTRVALHYYNTARRLNSRFISIILTCEAEENERRLTAQGRGGSNTKLTEVGILRAIWQEEDIYHFDGENELEINVSETSPQEAAKAILEFIENGETEIERPVPEVGKCSA